MSATTLRYRTVNVFTDRPYAGNPLSVVLDADELSDAQMLTITREFGYSETAFLCLAEPARPRLRIFTPTGELPFAGHPTIGAAAVLAAERPELLRAGTLYVRIGPVPVDITVGAEGVVQVELTAPMVPELGPEPPPVEELAALLGLPLEALAVEDDRPEAWAAGVPYTFVPLRSAAEAGRIRFDQLRWQALMAETWAPQVYVLARSGAPEDQRVHARMFSPALGTLEDGGTGAAAAALGGYLAARRDAPDDGELRYLITQGVELGRLSVLRGRVSIEAGTVREVRVGGAVVPICQGTLPAPAI